MGLSFCSEADIGNNASGVCNDQNLIINKFQDEAYEEEDVDYNNEEGKRFNVRDSAIRQMFASTPQLPSWNVNSKSEPTKQHQSCRHDLSLRSKMSERSRNPFHDEFVEEKREAKLYMNALQDSSMHELSVAFQNAESMLEKGNNIHEEVKRQGTIVKQANRDIEAIEKDIRDTSHRLKGMKSMKNKFKNIVCSKRGGPKGFVVHESDDISFDFTRSYTLPARLPSYDEKMTKQEWINKGVDQLCHVLDEVEHRQEDIGKELGEQEKHFQYLDHNINHVEHKIKNQTKIMSSIRKK